MRHWALSAAIGAAILISSSGSASPAQGVVSGSYVRDEDRSDDAFQAIENAISGVPSAKRPLARKRLSKSIAVYRMRISIAGSRVGIAYDDKAPFAVEIGGQSVKWKLIEVLVFDVSAKANGEAISLTFRSADSERVTTYRSVGQDLVADTTMTSPLLSTPIVYRQIFKRTN
ncbi:hypothetical protein [Sphingomonas xinjiangensis]|uniref:Uncharacterized protein n=1 Tax=Sphingomonas xinjiangensis TaxID=643568 RepID=A0A840YT14_9SPHN|nr:hypothetical protein [Sphingomonas xinjiangensis]MBB5712797.1 hypothetical protein [Sphingomonas xinjiangensis]